MITEGRMQYLYDETGRRYLDVRLRAVACCHACLTLHQGKCAARWLVLSCAAKP